MIIGVSGKIGSGKDTVGKIIQYLTTRPDMSFSTFMLLDHSEIEYTWKIKKFAYKLKRMVYMLTGIKVEDLEKQGVKDRALGPEWNMTVRMLLQKLGTDAIRNNVHPNAWVNALMVDYKECANWINWIITDCRFPNEAQAIEERGGIMIRVERPRVRLISIQSTDAAQEEHDRLGAIYAGTEHPYREQCLACGKTAREQAKGCSDITCYKGRPQHASETALDDYTFKHTINNSGTIEELVEQVRTILKQEGIL